MYYDSIDSPLGIIHLLADENGLRYLMIGKAPKEMHQRTPTYFSEHKKQLNEYFAGKRKAFDLVLAPKGTDFQRKVWQALYEIPYGETKSYGQIASAIGRPKAYRAVGGANNVNPIPLIIPCHRVIGSNGAMVGFGYGIEMKKTLLALENRS